MAKESILPYYLLTGGFMSFPGALVWSEMHKYVVSSI